MSDRIESGWRAVGVAVALAAVLALGGGVASFADTGSTASPSQGQECRVLDPPRIDSFDYPPGTSNNAGRDVAVDGDGNIFVTDTQNYAVLKLTPMGVASEFARLGSPVGGGPNALAVDPTGNVYVAADDKNVFVLSADGAGTNIGPALPAGSTERSARGIVLDGAGDVYVLTGTGRVTRIPAGPGGFGVPTEVGTTGVTSRGLVTDDAGNFYTALYSAGRVDRLREAVAPAGVASTGVKPVGMARGDDGALYTVNEESETVTKVVLTDPENGTASTLGSTGKRPFAIAVDHDGNVYTSNIGSSTVTRIDGATPEVVAPVNSPHGLTVDKYGNVYVAGQHQTDGVTRITKVDCWGDPNPPLEVCPDGTVGKPPKCRKPLPAIKRPTRKTAMLDLVANRLSVRLKCGPQYRPRCQGIAVAVTGKGGKAKPMTSTMRNRSKAGAWKLIRLKVKKRFRTRVALMSTVNRKQLVVRQTLTIRKRTRAGRGGVSKKIVYHRYKVRLKR